MTFIWPKMLAALVLIPLMIAFHIHLQRRRDRISANAENFASGQPGSRLPGRRRHIPALLFLAGLSIMIIALARPEMTISLPRLEGTVILVFDVSGSMAAEDLQPNRMAAAKASASEFVQDQPPSVQIGVVAFSESGLAVQAPTNDQDVILASINRLAPERGTSIGYGILSALETFSDDDGDNPENREQPALTPAAQGSNGKEIIVLLTDGENTAPPDPFEAAYAAAKRGIRIYSIGIGSPEGAILEVDGYRSIHN